MRRQRQLGLGQLRPRAVADITSGNAIGFIQHNGDMCGNVACGAGMPTWSHDGQNIVYVSTNAALSGRFNQEIPHAGPNRWWDGGARTRAGCRA